MKTFAILFVLVSALSVSAVASENTGTSAKQKLEITAVSDSPLLTLADLKNAAIKGSGDQTLLMVQLQPDAVARVQDYSAKHVDSRLAILVDGDPVMAPRIRVPLGDRFEMGPLKHAQAERLAALINHPTAEK